MTDDCVDCHESGNMTYDAPSFALFHFLELPHAENPSLVVCWPATPMASHFRSDQAVCRAAIALNNIGWSLLERECYDQAHLTLKDAALAMISLVHDGEGQAQWMVEASLYAANQRLAFPRRSSPPPAALERETCPEPVRLDVDELVVVDAAPLDFVAIAVNNIAVSHFFQATAAAGSPAEQGRLLAKAVSLLRLSYSIISEAGDYAPTTIAHALQILENLSKVRRFPVPSAAVSTAPERAGAGEVRETATAETDAELAQLLVMVHSLERANAAMFGSTIFAAAA
jgi:hypothetical protein